MLDLEFPGFMTNPKRSVPESSCRPESKKEACCQGKCYLMEEKSFPLSYCKLLVTYLENSAIDSWIL